MGQEYKISHGRQADMKNQVQKNSFTNNLTKQNPFDIESDNFVCPWRRDAMFISPSQVQLMYENVWKSTNVIKPNIE